MSYLNSRPHVIIGATTIPVEVVSSKEDIDKGLSHRPSLEASEGMLFLFDHSGLFKFWMKGMRFPLDLVWINAEHKIVDITKNVQPPGFFSKLQEPVFYSPSELAQYVLEVNANFCDTHDVKIGNTVEFKSLEA